MYQFTTTTIINSSLDSNGTTAKYSGTADAFSVTRVNTFKKANIVSVYKNIYTAGVKEEATVTVPTITAGLVARLAINVRLSQHTDSEYADSSTFFNKPVTVEVIAKGVPATDAAALVKQINGLRDRFGFAYITASVDTVDSKIIVLKATNNYQRFNTVVISEEIPNNDSVIAPQYKDVTNETFTIKVNGKVGFGDDEFMIRSIMIPSSENTRHLGINSEERPILGGNYTQFTIRYAIDKQDDGIIAGYKSITTHVFYVKSNLVASFEAAIIASGTPVTSIGTEQTFILTATDDETDAVKIDISDITPFLANASEITASSSDVAVATIGEITISPISGTPLAQTARIVLTKVAAGETTISVTVDGVTKEQAVTIG